MSKTDKPVRMLTCKATGIQFPYSGRGRPAHFCPAEQKRRKAASKAKRSADYRAKKAAAKQSPDLPAATA